MAKNKRKNFLNLAQKYSKKPKFKDYEPYFGMMNGDASYTVYEPWTKNDTDLVKKILDEVNDIGDKDYRKTIYKDCELFKNDGEILRHMDHKMLEHLADVMSKINTLNKRYEKIKENAVVPDSISKEYDKAFQLYHDSLQTIGANLDNLRTLKEFGVQTYAETMTDANLDFESENDLAIARAFEYIGVNIQRTVNPDKTIIWAFQSYNDHGISLMDKDNPGKTIPFRLDDKEVQGFLDAYLNKPIGDRDNNLITPDGIFQFYLKKFNEQATSKGFSLVERSALKLDKRNNEEIYNTNPDNYDWQEFLLTDDRLVKMNATRIALAEMFESSLVPTGVIEDLKLDESSLVNAEAIDELFEDSVGIKGEIERQKDATHVSNFEEEYNSKIKELNKLIKLANDPDRKKDLVSRRDALVVSRFQMKQFVLIQKEIVSKAIEKQSAGAKLSLREKSEAIKEIFSQMDSMQFVSFEKNDGVFSFKFDEKDPHYKEIETLCGGKDALDEIINARNEKLSKNKQKTANQTTADPKAVTPDSETAEKVDKEDPAEDQKDNASDETPEFTVNALDVWEDILGLTDTTTQEPIFSTIIAEGENVIAEIISPLATSDKDLKFAVNRSDPNYANNYKLDIVRAGKIFDKLTFRDQTARDIAKTYADLKAKGDEESIKNLIGKVKDDVFSAIPTIDDITSEDYEKYSKSMANLNQIGQNMTHMNAYGAVLNDKQKQALNDKTKECATNARDMGIITPEEFNNVTGTPEISDETKIETKYQTYKEKYPKFDVVGLQKKLKPYCAKSTEKIIDDIIKMIENTKIKETVVTNPGPQPEIKKNSDNSEKSDKENKENEDLSGADKNKQEEQGQGNGQGQSGSESEQGNNVDGQGGDSTKESDNKQVDPSETNTSGEKNNETKSETSETSDNAQTPAQEPANDATESTETQIEPTNEPSDNEENQDEDDALVEGIEKAQEEAKKAQQSKNNVRNIERLTYAALGAKLGLWLKSDKIQVDDSRKDALTEYKKVFDYLGGIENSENMTAEDKDLRNKLLEIMSEKAFNTDERFYGEFKINDRQLSENDKNPSQVINGQPLDKFLESSNMSKEMKDAFTWVLVTQNSTLLDNLIIPCVTTISNGTNNIFIGNELSGAMIDALENCKSMEDMEKLVSENKLFSRLMKGFELNFADSFNKSSGYTDEDIRNRERQALLENDGM